MRFLFRVGLVLCWSGAVQAHAAVLTGSGAGKAVEGVTTSSSATVQIAGRVHQLQQVGAGLRYKKVAFIKAKVYVGELFVDAPSTVVKTKAGALDSLTAEKTIAIRMTFLRDVGGEKVSNGFKEALEENQVKLDTPSIKDFLDAVKNGGEAKETKTLTVVGERLSDGKESVTYENAAGKAVTIVGSKGFMHDLLSIWFGKIDDSGLENLENEILGT